MKILDGVRIVEMAAIGPVPWASMLLADMGADVVRIGRPGKPIENVPTMRGRTSISLDLKTAHDLSVAKRLIGQADVLLEGMRPGALERLGLSPEACFEDNPSLVEYVKAIGRIATGLVQACGSRQLLLTYRNLPHDTVWQMLWVTSEPLDYTTPERRSLSFRHHQDLFDHMGAGDANGAERVMRKIMNDSCLEVLGRMAQTRQIELDPGRIEAL